MIRAVTLSIVDRHLRQIGELLLDALVLIIHACRSLRILALALTNTPLLLSCIGECLAVVRLATRLSCALLVLSTDERVHMGCILLLRCHLRLLIETLRPVTLLDTCHCQIMIVTFEKLLNTGSLELGLMLEHLFRVGILPLAVSVLGIEVVFSGRWHKGSLHALLT